MGRALCKWLQFAPVFLPRPQFSLLPFTHTSTSNHDDNDFDDDGDDDDGDDDGDDDDDTSGRVWASIWGRQMVRRSIFSQALPTALRFWW